MGREIDGKGSSLGRLIMAERQRRSWTREELAAEVRRANRTLGTTGRTIQRWELEGVPPQPAAKRALADVFGMTVERLSTAGNIGAEEDEDTKRREFLALLAAASSGLIDVERLAAPTVDAAYLREAETLTAALLGQWYTAAPSMLLAPVLAHLRGLQRALPGTAELENLTGRTALLAGHLCTMLSRTGDARGHYALAESLASDTGYGDLQIAGLIARSALHDRRRGGEPRRSMQLVEQAATIVGPGTSPRIRTWAFARRAEERAGVGDVVGFERDMAMAEAALRSSEDRWPGPPRDATELAAYRGASELLLGRHAEAAETLAWTLDRMDESAVNWRALVAEDRDRALAAS